MEALGFGLDKVEERDPDFICLMDKEGDLVRHTKCLLMKKHWKEIQE